VKRIAAIVHQLIEFEQLLPVPRKMLGLTRKYPKPRLCGMELWQREQLQ
jgi:hypothetical protein